MALEHSSLPVGALACQRLWSSSGPRKRLRHSASNPRLMTLTRFARFGGILTTGQAIALPHHVFSVLPHPVHRTIGILFSPRSFCVRPRHRRTDPARPVVERLWCTTSKFRHL